jgi:hypothetical protein
MDKVPNADDFVEVYEADSAADADRIVHLVLSPEGIECILHDRITRSFPAPSTTSGEASIAVPVKDKDRAIALLREYFDAAKEPGAGTILDRRPKP